mmetsp:Transcript_70357/g.187476  ORF Transcript_70357/g.187476 Transcript_70357/m.187476 type:complete len:84 (+) Transcript_70357:645-896(+)
MSVRRKPLVSCAKAKRFSRPSPLENILRSASQDLLSDLLFAWHLFFPYFLLLRGFRGHASKVVSECDTPIGCHMGNSGPSSMK